MNTYTWITKNLYTIDNVNQKGYVATAIVEITATDINQRTASATNVCEFKVKKNNTNFIPYADLTNDIIVAWVKDELGNKTVKDIQRSLDAQIKSQEKPPKAPKNTPLPFTIK